MERTPHRDSLPIAEGLLHRPRVNNLIRRGLQQSLLIMLAGSGWGKTQAMAAYLQKSEMRVLWLRLNKLDNIPSHFWDHFVYALAAEFSDIQKQVQTLEFPDTSAKQQAFLRLLSRSFDGQKHVVWVFDDFGEIKERQAMEFFSTLVNMELDAFHLVLLSNVTTDTTSVAFLANRRALILSKDLRFTRDETADLYRLHGIPLEADELDEIQQYTEGWPLPLHLLVMQRGNIRDLVLENGKLNQNAIARLLEEYFLAESKAGQKLHLKLSLLSSFTLELGAELYEGENARLNGTRNYAFLAAEPATGRQSFHHLYQLFLETKQYLLNEEEKRQVWAKAAEYYLKAGNYFDAVDYYSKCEDHDGMMNAMVAFVKTEHGVNMHGVTPENTAFFLAHLDLLTPEETQRHPVADYFRALVCLNTMELEKAESFYMYLERRLLHSGTPEDLALLGDVYAMWGALRMMMNKLDYGDYYKKAAGYLPNGSNLQSAARLHTFNNHSFSMADNGPGALERAEKAAHYGIPWAAKALNGGMSGMEHLYSAEAAYLTGRFEEVKQHAWRAIYKAEPNAQHDLVCNSYMMLARTALIQGSYAEMKENIQNIVDYARQYGIGILKDIRDTALGWYYIKLFDYEKIPKSLLAQSRSGRAVMSYGRDVIIYANYLINTGEYAKLVGMLEYPVGLFLADGIWPDRICGYIMLAIGYHRLGDRTRAIKALWDAYDLCYHNGLTTLFIEGEWFMSELVVLARQQQDYCFDPEWLDRVEREADAFSARADKVRKAYGKDNPMAQNQDNPLTKREIEILQALAAGSTREEIALTQYISINTVKTYIRNIYNKLDAANRAEAATIAISRGYISVPESKALRPQYDLGG